MITPLQIDSETPAQAFDQEIDGVVLRFEISWNNREGAYSVDIYTPAREPIVEGLRVSMKADIIDHVVDDRLPPGRIIPIDSSGKDDPPGYLELGDRVDLVYVPEG